MGNDVNSSCPVCGFGGISSQETCPQCDSDLTCFDALEAMSGEDIPKTVERGKGINRFFSLLSVVLIMTSIFLFYRLNRLKETIYEIQTDLFYSIKEVASETVALKKVTYSNLDVISEMKRAQIRESESAPSIIPEKNPSESETADIAVSLDAIKKDNADDEFIIYDAKKEDTLWEIAEKFYGKGIYYPVIIEHNPSIDIYGIGDGIRLKILKNRDLVGDAYRQITYYKWPSLYMRYEISEGETVKSIAKKFYKSENRESMIMELNPELTLTPGNRINILLN